VTPITNRSRLSVCVRVNTPALIRRGAVFHTRAARSLPFAKFRRIKPFPFAVPLDRGKKKGKASAAIKIEVRSRSARGGRPMRCESIPVYHARHDIVSTSSLLLPPSSSAPYRDLSLVTCEIISRTLSRDERRGAARVTMQSRR